VFLNETTSTGEINVANLTLFSGTYTIQVFSDGYYTEQRVFTFDDQENLDLSFYLLKVNETNSQTLTIRALDIAQRLVSGATIDLLEYDSDTLSYIEVSECTTNEEGECEFLIELGTKTYKWQGTKTENGDSLFGETEVGETFQASIVSGEEVVFSELSRDLILRVSDTFNLDLLNYLYYDITESFASNVSNIAVSFYTSDGTDTTVCVEYFELISGIRSSLTGDTYCVTGSSATVLPATGFTLNGSKDYVAVVSAERDNKITLEEFFYYGR